MKTATVKVKNMDLVHQIKALTALDSFGVGDFITSLAVGKNLENLSRAHQKYSESIQPIIDKYVAKDEHGQNMIQVSAQRGPGGEMIQEWDFGGNAENKKAFMEEKLKVDNEEVDVRVASIPSSVLKSVHEELQKLTPPRSLPGSIVYVLKNMIDDDLKVLTE